MPAIVAYATEGFGGWAREDVELQVDIDSGLMEGARYLASPNYDARPGGVQAELIVVHGISLPPGEFGGPWIDRLFTNSLPPDVHPYFAEIGAMRVSSHLLVARDGGLTQFVRFTDRAWHAGESAYDGRTACNDFSIGVELEGVDTIPYEAAQYDTLAEVVAALCDAYPRLSADRMVGHSDISPGRKTDPGPAFDWQRAHRCIAAAREASPRR
jgi:N-acetyl-anhydromuramoyl-L-alanine amidase